GFRVVGDMDETVQDRAERGIQRALVALSRNRADKCERGAVLVRRDDAGDPAVAKPRNAVKRAVERAGPCLAEKVVRAGSGLPRYIASAGDDDRRVWLLRGRVAERNVFKAEDGSRIGD